MPPRANTHIGPARIATDWIDVAVELAPLLWDDAREGAQVALVDAVRNVVSETLTASVRRTGTDVFSIVEPRAFTFTRLRAATVVGLGVYVGTWRGTLEFRPRAMRPGDKFHLHLPGDCGCG